MPPLRGEETRAPPPTTESSRTDTLNCKPLLPIPNKERPSPCCRHFVSFPLFLPEKADKAAATAALQRLPSRLAATPSRMHRGSFKEKQHEAHSSAPHRAMAGSGDRPGAESFRLDRRPRPRGRGLRD